MRNLIAPFIVIAAVITVASAYGYKYARNPYSGECALQLNLPGGVGQTDAYRPGIGIKDAYPGIMNTRYGSDDGQYHANHHAGGNYHGAASSHHSALASGASNHHGSASSQSADRFQGGSNYGTGSGRYPSSSESNYGSGSLSNNNYGSASSSNNNFQSAASNENYGSSGSSYGSSANSQSNYGSTSGNRGSGSGNYGGSGGNYNGNDYDNNSNYGSSGNSGSGNYGSSSTNYESNSSTGQNNRGSNYGGSNNRDRDTGSYGSGSSNYDRDTGNYGSASSSNYDRDTSNYGSSNNRESSIEASNSYGTSGHRGSSSSSGHRGHHNSNSHQGSSSSSNGSRGSGGSYGGGSSSSENYGNRGSSNSNNNYGQNNDFLDKRFAREVLIAHNSYRARHDTPPVTLDEKISLRAQEWANKLASGRVIYGHSPMAVEGVYGESLQVMNVDNPTGTEVIDHWYKERYNYDFKSPLIVKKPRSSRNSHFTAIVWRATKKIGVGKATSNDGRSFIVVSYWPPGNIVDVLEDNVLPSRPGSSIREKEPFY